MREAGGVPVAAGSDWVFNSVPKSVPLVELPLPAGMSDLRRNAGGVYAARDEILNVGLT
jgi:hypothetical protein